MRRVAKLRQKIDNALDETRMLVLGAQVLIGFQYGAVFQPDFERLEPPLQILKVIGLALLLLALGFPDRTGRVPPHRRKVVSPAVR